MYTRPRFLALLGALALAACATNDGVDFPDAPPRADQQPTCHDVAINYREAMESIAFPPGPRDKGVSGWVLLAYDLDGSGVARNLRVLKSSPPGVFDAAALRAYSDVRFKPDVQRGVCRAFVGFSVRKG